MTPVEKQIRNHAMRAYHAAARLRTEAERERKANYDACMRALSLREQADQAAERAQQHSERAAQFDKDAAAKDDEQKQWEALLPPVSVPGADVVGVAVDDPDAAAENEIVRRC